MRCAAVLLAALLAVPSPASAWGFEAHKFIVDRMIALLPAELRPLFEKRRAFIVERAIDPDLWRNVGWDEEPPNHFLDLDHEQHWRGIGQRRSHDRIVGWSDSQRRRPDRRSFRSGCAIRR